MQNRDLSHHRWSTMPSEAIHKSHSPSSNAHNSLQKTINRVLHMRVATSRPQSVCIPLMQMYYVMPRAMKPVSKIVCVPTMQPAFPMLESRDRAPLAHDLEPSDSTSTLTSCFTPSFTPLTTPIFIFLPIMFRLPTSL